MKRDSTEIPFHNPDRIALETTLVMGNGVICVKM